MSEILAGRNPVREALRAGNRTINKVLVARTAHGSAIEEIVRLARERGIPVHHVPPEKLDAVGPEHNQGVMAEVAATTYLDLDELWEKTGGKPGTLYVILDGIEDPHNLGAILRSAVAFGADGVIIGKWRSAALTETVARSSAGASEHIPIARVSNIAETISRLKERGVWVAGADVSGKPLPSERLPFPLAVVIGSEGHGLHDLVRKRCDFLVAIPQERAISSLNASCAAAVVLYEVHRQRPPRTPAA